MTDARLRWVFPEPYRLDATLRAAARELGVGTFAATVMARRGIADPVTLAAFLGPAAAGLNDPRRLPDAAALVERVARARDRGERVMVFGDFDADGLTGLAQLVLAFRRLGIRVTPYVPSRLDEGHGLSLAAVDAAAGDGITLIVTVDTGSTSVAEVAAARARGIDVAVTDHHRLPEVLPAAVALVNPQRADSEYPGRGLSGSGVAFTVARLLLAELASGEADALPLAELAVIGTVSDVVPVLGENRAIARLGLEQMRTSPRPGIAALLAKAGVKPATADLETVSFAIAPRLNAAGRVGEALDAARLLLAEDPAEAAALADGLEAANRTRRDLTKSAIEEARAAVAAAGDGDLGATVVRGDWPVGIVGLVASRLVEDLGRPAVVGANLGSTIRASCRSDGTLDLGAALEACHDLFTRYGGHAGAAGFEIETERWEAFRTRVELLAHVTRAADPRPALAVDLALPAAAVDYALHRELLRLAPCGPGNADPVVAILGLTVTRVRAASGGHTQLTLRRVRDVVDAIAFDRGDLAETVVVGDVVDVVGRLASRRFVGLESLQIK